MFESELQHTPVVQQGLDVSGGQDVQRENVGVHDGLISFGGVTKTPWRTDRAALARNAPLTTLKDISVTYPQRAPARPSIPHHLPIHELWSQQLSSGGPAEEEQFTQK